MSYGIPNAQKGYNTGEHEICHVQLMKWNWRKGPRVLSVCVFVFKSARMGGVFQAKINKALLWESIKKPGIRGNDHRHFWYNQNAQKYIPSRYGYSPSSSPKHLKWSPRPLRPQTWIFRSFYRNPSYKPSWLAKGAVEVSQRGGSLSGSRGPSHCNVDAQDHVRSNVTIWMPERDP